MMGATAKTTKTDLMDGAMQKLKTTYSSQLESLVEIFQEWSEVDLLSILDDVQGDFDMAVSRISEGE